MKNSNQSNWQIFIPLYLFVIVFSLILYGFSFPSSNLIIHIPYIQVRLDPELYPQDFYVQESIQFTPRYYYQHLIVLGTKLGLTIPLTYFFYYVLSFGSFTLGLYAIGKKFGRSTLSGAVLAFLGLTAVGGTVGYTSLFRTEPTPATFAMGLSIWGIYFCFSQRWIAGYFFFGLACLLQFLVGLLPGLLFIPLLLLNNLKSKNLIAIIFSLTTLGIFAALVYLPMLLSGTTDSEFLTNSEFIYWYGYIRHPHHVIPSLFAIQNWRSFIALMIGGVVCITSSKILDKCQKMDFLIILSMSFIALFLGYVFVELYPSSLLMKLQLARTTPFAKLVVLIAISITFIQYYRQRNLTVCVLLLIPPIIKNGAILFCFIALGLAVLESTQTISKLRSKLFFWIALLGLLLLLACYPWTHSAWGIFNRVFYKLLLFGVLIVPSIIKSNLLSSFSKKVVAWGLAILAVIYFSLGFFGILSKQLPAIALPQLSNSNLAKQFRQLSRKDALILVPPSQDIFRLQSERSVVFGFKSFPFTDAGIKEWSNRLKVLMGLPKVGKVDWGNRNLKYRNLSSDKLIDIAQSFGAQYILTYTSWHPNMKGTLIAKDGKWVIYKIE